MIDQTLVMPLEARALAQAYPSNTFRARSGRGLVILLDVTDKTSTPNISKVELQAQGPAGTWATIYEFTGQTIAAAGLFKYCIYPGAASAAGWTSAPLQGPIPGACDLRLKVTHDNTNSITYATAVHFPA